eukprot:1160024-Pelagomonas_calceolata.AAC.1
MERTHECTSIKELCSLFVPQGILAGPDQAPFCILDLPCLSFQRTQHMLLESTPCLLHPPPAPSFMMFVLPTLPHILRLWPLLNRGDIPSCSAPSFFHIVRLWPLLYTGDIPSRSAPPSPLALAQATVTWNRFVRVPPGEVEEAKLTLFLEAPLSQSPQDAPKSVPPTPSAPLEDPASESSALAAQQQQEVEAKGGRGQQQQHQHQHQQQSQQPQQPASSPPASESLNVTLYLQLDELQRACPCPYHEEWMQFYEAMLSSSTWRGHLDLGRMP